MSLHEKGQYERAASVALRTLELADRFGDPDHPYLAASLNNLAGIYDAQGRYLEAEPLYQRSLEIRERVKGSGHADVAATLNN
ncbi:MAG: tetratricopeptide repeat protein, partial [Synergistales bacterium]|nr:tetratricopeptide repeat protein [Synergistales bacterium]